MTDYYLNSFRFADAEALAGKTADVTEWDDDEGDRLITYPAARVAGVGGAGSAGWLAIEHTQPAVVTDRNTGTCLARRPLTGPWRVGLHWIVRVENVRGGEGWHDSCPRCPDCGEHRHGGGHMSAS